MPSPVVSVVGRVVILVFPVHLCASQKLCTALGCSWSGDFPAVCVCNTSFHEGRAVSLPLWREDCTQELWVWWPGDGNTDGPECCLGLWGLHTFGNGCGDSDPLPYVLCLFLAKPQLWASGTVLGRLNKPGFWYLKVLGVGFGKLAFNLNVSVEA